MAVKIFFDTEFIENGTTIDLISIGMVKETGEEYYAVSSQFDASKASPWVQKHILSYIPSKPAQPIVRDEFLGLSKTELTEEHLPYRTRSQIASDILAFVGSDRPIFWAYYGAYDWIALAQLYGQMLQLPPGWPRFCRDIKQYASMIGNPRMPSKPEKEHHALEDARWTKRVFDYLREVEGLQNHGTMFTF
jgi:hypothetical protein